MYNIGEEYKFGKYLGVINVFRYKKDYVEKVHKFAKPGVDHKCSTITEIFIEKIPKT